MLITLSATLLERLYTLVRKLDALKHDLATERKPNGFQPGEFVSCPLLLAKNNLGRLLHHTGGDKVDGPDRPRAPAFCRSNSFIIASHRNALPNTGRRASYRRLVVCAPAIVRIRARCYTRDIGQASAQATQWAVAGTFAFGRSVSRFRDCRIY